MTPRRRRQILLPAVLLGAATVAAVAAVLLGSGGGNSALSVTATGAVSAGPFRTAATMPAGLAARLVPRFALADARGGTLSSRELSGRPYALTFLYVHCRDVCPLIGSEVQAALTQLGPRARAIEAIAVSVDPRGDSRSAVREWLAAHREPANFHYLIGSEPRLTPIWKAFFVSPQTPGDPASTHTAVIWLINRKGHPAALIPAGVQVNVKDLARDFEALIAR